MQTDETQTYRLSTEMAEVVADAVMEKHRCIVLVKTETQAENFARRLRQVIQERGKPVALDLLRPEGANPNFIRCKLGGWAFIWPIDDLDPDDEIAQTNWVYWPTEGGTYQRIPYAKWKAERSAGNMYRPVEAKPKKHSGAPLTAWERLLDDE